MDRRRLGAGVCRYFLLAIWGLGWLPEVFLAGCNGAKDIPFTLRGTKSPVCVEDADCKKGQTCNVRSGACEGTPAGNAGCQKDQDCSPELPVCDAATHQCVAKPASGEDHPPATGPKSPLECPPECPKDQTCDKTTNECVLAEACEVDYHATLTLKIDDNFPNGRYDSPPRCCNYAAAEGQGTCPDLDPKHLNRFLQPPSENSDLYCCGPKAGGDVSGEAAPSTEEIPGHPELFCDPENRHNGDPELAATRWAASQNQPIRLKFKIPPDGSTCRVALLRDLFPPYPLENSALDASLIIDAGKNYQTLPPQPPQPLNPYEIIGDCTVVSSDDPTQARVEIVSLPLRFMVQLYQNFIQCTEVFDAGADHCPSAPFTKYFQGESPGSFQIIPASTKGPLILTTGSVSQDPLHPDRQPAGPLTAQGAPLHYDPDAKRTSMKLVTAFSLPEGANNTTRNDETGGGTLLLELGGAILTASFEGTVTKPDGQPATLDDLTHCQPPAEPPHP